MNEELSGTWPNDTRDVETVLGIIRNASMTLWAAEGEEGDYAIRIWSPGAERVYGYTEELALGRNYIELFVNPKEQAKAITDHKDIVETGSAYEWNWEADDLAADGSTRTIITNCFRYWDTNRQKWLLAELGVDLKDKGDAERKLRALQEGAIREAEAERSSSTLRAFDILNDAIAEVRQMGGGVAQVAEAIPAAARLAFDSVAHAYVWMLDNQSEPSLVAPAEVNTAHLPFQLETVVSRLRSELRSSPGTPASELTFFAHDPTTGEIADYCRPGRRSRQPSFAVAPLLQGNNLSGIYTVVFGHGNPLDVKERSTLNALTKHAGWAMAVGAVGEELHIRRQAERERDRIETRTQVVEAMLHTVGNEAVVAASRVETLQRQLESGDFESGSVSAALEEMKEHLGLLNSAMDQFQADLEGSDTPTDVALVDVVNMVANPFIGDVDIDIEVAVPTSTKVHAAKLLLREALKCVVDNAVQILKLEDGGGQVRVVATTATSTEAVVVLLDVEDDGPGVADEDRDLIWRRDVTRRPDGHGRGLPIAQNLMDMIGGSIQLMPDPSSLGGAHFRFTIPTSVEGNQLEP